MHFASICALHQSEVPSKMSCFWPAPSSDQWDGVGCVFDIDIIISWKNDHLLTEKLEMLSRNAIWPAPSSEQWDGTGCVFDIDNGSAQQTNCVYKYSSVLFGREWICARREEQFELMYGLWDKVCCFGGINTLWVIICSVRIIERDQKRNYVENTAWNIRRTRIWSDESERDRT